VRAGRRWGIIRSTSVDHPSSIGPPERGTVTLESLGSVLGVWAHPDDDIYLSSGLMVAGVRGGGRVVDVTATRGEGGSMDEERWPPASMGEVRTRELLRSLEILGVHEHRFLDGPVDLDMGSPLDESGAAQVLDIVRDVQPDTILTFGPEGMTGHQGHKDVCRWATEAFHAAAPPGSSLYYAVMAPEIAEEWLPRLEPFEIFLPGTPRRVTRDEIALSFDLPPDVLDLKVQAIAAHESQIEGLLEVFGKDGFKEFMREECFTLAARKPAESTATMEDDG
jgi:LmbE family N-acetylglucosaminyl deacetylase